MQKQWFYSKTLWMNLIALVAMLAQNYTGFVIDIEAQGALLIVINIILRIVTKEEVVFSSRKR